MIELFRGWLTDESGYDEETWPKLTRALKRERARSRRSEPIRWLTMAEQNGVDLATNIPPSVHRLPFPAVQELAEKDVVELSRQAMILDGKRSQKMRPVPSGYKDQDGRDLFFVRWKDEGWILWWLERPDRIWDYSVGIKREGDEIVCTILKPP